MRWRLTEDGAPYPSSNWRFMPAPAAFLDMEAARKVDYRPVEEGNGREEQAGSGRHYSKEESGEQGQ